MSEKERMLLKDNILENIKKAIKAIHQFQILNCLGDESATVLSNDDWQCHKLCENLDHAFLHGLRHSSSSYWIVVKQFTRKEAIKEIERLQNVATDLGRARAWLFMSLNENLMESYIKCLADSKKELKKYYAKEAFLLDQQRMNVLMTLTSGLDFMCFQLEYNVPYLDLRTTPPGGRVCPEPMLKRPIEDDRLSIQSTDSHRSRTPNSVENVASTSNSPRAATDSDTASVNSIDTGGPVSQIISSRSFSASVDSGCLGDVMVSSSSSTGSKRQSAPDTASISSQETESRETRIQRIESIVSENVDSEEEGLEVIRVRSKACTKPRKKKSKHISKPSGQVDPKILEEKRANELIPVDRLSGVARARAQDDRLHNLPNSIPQHLSEGQTDFPVIGSRLSPPIGLKRDSVDSEYLCNILSNNQQEKSFIKQDSNCLNQDSRESLDLEVDGADDSPFVDSGSANRDQCLLDNKNVLYPYFTDNVKLMLEVDQMCSGSTPEMTSVVNTGQDHLIRTVTPVQQVPSRSLTDPLTQQTRSPKQHDAENDFNEHSLKGSHTIVKNMIENKQDHDLGSKTKKLVEDLVDTPFSALAFLHPEEPSPFEKIEKSIDVSKNNLKLQLILNVFQSDDENLIKMFATRMGHTDGDFETVFVLVTDVFIYITRQKESDKTFITDAAIRLSELDYITVGLQHQMLQIVCTDRRKKYLLTTGDSALTRAIIKCLTSVMSDLTILSDDPTQKICLTKSAARDCHCQLSEVEIADYCLVFWEDPQSRTGVASSASREGKLFLRMSDTFRGPAWRLVYVTLRDQILCIFESPNASKPERFVRLGSEQCAGCRLVTIDDREFCIQIILADGSSWELSAPSYGEVTSWQQQLCQAVSEGMQALTSWSCVPCSVLLTSAKLLMYHEDSQTQFHRLLGSASVDEVTAVTVDPACHTYCILEFESQEAAVSSEQWVLYFNTPLEMKQFIRALSRCWTQFFQVEVPINEIDNLPLQDRCRITSRRLEDLLQVSR